MWLLWVGVALLLLKLAGLGPFGEMSWWWVVLPLVLSFVWFELFEKRLGLDKKKAFDELDRAKQERIKKAMQQAKRPRGR
jgi:small Trp-rich protein